MCHYRASIATRAVGWCSPEATVADLNRHAAPTDLNRHAAPTDLYRDAAPIDLCRDAAPIDLCRDAAPIDLCRDAAPIDLYRDAAPIDLCDGQGRVQHAPGNGSHQTLCLQFVLHSDLQVWIYAGRRTSTSTLPFLLLRGLSERSGFWARSSYFGQICPITMLQDCCGPQGVPPAIHSMCSSNNPVRDGMGWIHGGHLNPTPSHPETPPPKRAQTTLSGPG